jgi:hypothetical protein
MNRKKKFIIQSVDGEKDQGNSVCFTINSYCANHQIVAHTSRAMIDGEQ